ncbi:MAG TPA: zinc metalloprotease HtpX [Candidatus Saccharimonadales bacterium]|jgi:heat shock protein HtpX
MYSEIARNKQKTWVIMAFFIAFVALIGYLLTLFMGYPPYMTIGVLIGAAIYTLVMYYSGSKLSLAVNGAKEIQKSDNPRLWRIVENLAITEGLPMPKVYIMEDPAPNAFATGRDPAHAAVCATTGILEIMDDNELEGVFAHEMGHVKNYDIRVSMIAFALAGVISLIADIMLHMTFFRSNDDEGGNNNPVFFVLAIVGAILAPLIATLIQLAITRRREYLADATGALATRYPEGLASALEKIGSYGSVTRKQNSATAHLFFANPLKSGGISNLFSTHPPIEERVRRLREMNTHA